MLMCTSLCIPTVQMQLLSDMVADSQKLSDEKGNNKKLKRLPGKATSLKCIGSELLKGGFRTKKGPSLRGVLGNTPEGT